ncbi:ATP-grasp domain-containing protein [Methanofollis fontis]|uniref:ATP-utilizing enzyme (ATP-grasp superfamily) n=1 Tax=Methanofollis fontis TaxID=2052832 RepID=A0A483CTC4_9EURY|nr:ATP-grasp domain-containing protein [Methanofollis fontis]TAJ44498.1 ATP-utilizing enzyme (ATP-grasp superfamily) [Methanofollis fontis]
MRAFCAEYTVFHDPDLAVEGRAMLDVLSASFTRCGYEVVTPEGGDLAAEIRTRAPSCDVGLVIAPDDILASLTRAVEECTHNIGCGSMNVALCANKQRTAQILASHGIPTPAEKATGTKVIKPVHGCAAHGVRLSEAAPAAGEIGQEYIEGEHLSVSLVGSRIVGEACLYYSGAAPLVLAVNRQQVSLQDGVFVYAGGETPIEHPRHDEIVDAAVRAATVLGCQGYTGVDIVLADRPYVVDVNPRPTTSMAGIAACMEEEIAAILVDASYGKPPERVHFNGRVRFDKDGQVVRL